MRDLFLSPYHVVFVRRDGSKSDILMFHDAKEMRKVALYKMKHDMIAGDENRSIYAYAMLCATHEPGTRGMKVLDMGKLYGHETN